MKRKDYFKDKAIVFILFPILGILSIFTMSDAEIGWGIFVPIFFFSIAIGTALYGLLNYKK